MTEKNTDEGQEKHTDFSTAFWFDFAVGKRLRVVVIFYLRHNLKSSIFAMNSSDS